MEENGQIVDQKKTQHGRIRDLVTFYPLSMLALEDGDKGALQETMIMSRRQISHIIDSQIHQSSFWPQWHP